jgi:hypothetical protein
MEPPDSSRGGEVLDATRRGLCTARTRHVKTRRTPAQSDGVIVSP